MQHRPSSSVLKGKHSRGPAAYQQAFAVVDVNAEGWPILASTPSFDEMAGQSATLCLSQASTVFVNITQSRRKEALEVLCCMLCSSLESCLSKKDLHCGIRRLRIFLQYSGRYTIYVFVSGGRLPLYLLSTHHRQRSPIYEAYSLWQTSGSYILQRSRY